MTSRGRGRPAFKPTATLRREVEQMRSVGMSEGDIARAISCDPKTLRKYFSEEIINGGVKRRREVVSLLFKAARSGNVSAQRKLHEMTTEASAADKFLEAAQRPVAAVLDPPAPKLGKKEQAQAASDAAGEGSEWGHLVH